MRLFTWILKFYPRAWRTRYEAEVLVLLEEHHITFLTVFDLLFGALDAHLDPYYVKRAIAARGTRMVLQAAICFAIPFIIIGLDIARWPHVIFLPSQIISTFRYIFILFGELELLMGSVLITITKGRKAIATHKKRLRLFVVFVNLLLILIGCYIYQSFFDMAGGLPLSSLSVFFAVLEYMVVTLFPFFGFGTLLLAVTGGELSKRTLRAALIAASLLTLAMVVNLLATVSWEIIDWTQHATQVPAPTTITGEAAQEPPPQVLPPQMLR